MVDVTTQILISRPPDEVYTYSSNPDNAPRWSENIKSIYWKTEKPVQVGSKFAFSAEFLGRRISFTYEVVDLIPRELLVMSTAEGPFPMETTYRWESTPGGTRMTLRNQGHPSGFNMLISPFISHMMNKANQVDLAKLKNILERQVGAVAVDLK